jgi:hypothetical protein
VVVTPAYDSDTVTVRVVKYCGRVTDSWKMKYEEPIMYQHRNVPSDTFEARSNTPITGLVTALPRDCNDCEKRHTLVQLTLPILSLHL